MVVVKQKGTNVVRNRLIAGAVGIVVALVAVCGTFALADEVARTEYMAAVEPICKENATANEKILAGARTRVREGKLKVAASQFANAAAALMKTYAELNAVQKPAPDAPRLTKWLLYVKAEAKMFRSASKALKAGQTHKVEAFVAKLTHNANLANSQIVIFGFRYCKLEPSKYT